MAAINDRDRTAFDEASKTVLDNFSEAEQETIGKLAAQLKSVLEAAKKRAHDQISKSAGR